MTSTRRIVIAAYNGVSLLDLAGPLEAFRLASALSARGRRSPAYESVVVSTRGGAVRTSDAVDLVTQPIDSLDGKPIDTLIVPGGFFVDDVTRDRALVDWVRTRADDCPRICSVCVGSFLLAAAGLLDGRRAATHWLQCGLLAERYPAVSVVPDAIFVRDGQVWSSAGMTTGIDLALALIEEDFGRQLSLDVARVLVVYLKRSGGQSQYSALLAGQVESASDEFTELDRWIAENLTASLSVEALAERVHMSPRNFARVYTAKRSRTPGKAVEAIRVDAARRLLEDSDERLGSIAERCGFTNEERMRDAFVRTIGVAPREYRKRFTPYRGDEKFVAVSRDAGERPALPKLA
ncbi:MAG TPA: GlxA family transcriptional regulator [Gammaproteobacteria bacterium]|nr:GlxA family transcriptional regulator [Gammaproteobacteria bacterium]